MNRSIEKSRPKVAVSACLLGEPVRYDGQGKRDDWIAGELAEQFELVPVCPEVAIGMGVPREPIRINLIDGEPRAQGVDDAQRDVTVALRAYATEQARVLTGISGFVFKGRSPSCGLGSTPLFVDGQEQPQAGNGVFADEMHRRLPGLPAIEETALQQPQQQADFIRAVRCYYESRNG